MKKILGINDDRDFCQCCGKTGLARVVWIENDETGEVRHFGTTCATKNEPALFGEIKDALRQDNRQDESAWSFAHSRYKRDGGTYRTEYDPKHPGKIGHARWVATDPARLRKIRDAALAELRNGRSPWKLTTTPATIQPELFPA